MPRLLKKPRLPAGIAEITEIAQIDKISQTAASPEFADVVEIADREGRDWQKCRDWR